MIQDRILQFIYTLGLRHGRPVILAMGVITLFFAAFIPRLTISSSYNELVSPEEPEQARFLSFLEEFGAADELVVVLEGDPAILVSRADLFAAAIRNEKKYVRSVFYQIDVAGLLKWAPYFIPEDTLAEGLKGIGGYRPLIAEIARVKSLPSLLGLINRGLAGEIPGLDDPGTAATGLTIPRLLFREWRRFLEDPSREEIDYRTLLRGEKIEGAEMIESGGYLRSHDGRLLFLFVRPTSLSDDITFLEPFVGSVRQACDRVLKENPALQGKIAVAFTGMPAHALTEVHAINSDVARSTAISVLLVIAVLGFGFRSLKKILLAVIPLGCGMIITVGAISLTIGHLNLVSSSFLAVLFGIGIDFGIYLIRRTAEERDRGKTEEEAVRIAVTASGRSVLTGGLTTGLAFLAVGWTDFVGFSELGLTAGMGVLIVLFSTLLLLPALLLATRIRPAHYSLRRALQATARKRERLFLTLIVLAAGAGCVFGVFAATRLHFDFNALKLLPPGAESTIYQIRMQEESDFQMTCAAVTAPDLARLQRQVERIRALPTVSRVESLGDLIPEKPAEKQQLIAAYRPFLAGVKIGLGAPAAPLGVYRSELDAIRAGLESAQEAAFSGGRPGLVSAVEEDLSELDSLRNDLDSGQGTRAAERSRAFEKALFQGLKKLSTLLRIWLEEPPPTVDSLPPDLVARFKSPRGNYVAYVFPSGSIWDVDFLDRFVSGLKEIAPGATGFPVTHQLTSRVMVKSLLRALLYAFGIIVIMLLIDFKRPGPVFLSLIPLAVGMLWVQGAMYILGRNYDFASMPGLPLLLGLGIVYGIHIVRRWMEHPEITAFAATVTSGRGVAFAALTTMASLFSLIFSRHQGVASFGIIILIGIVATLVAALYVLPAVIDLLHYKKIHHP